MIIKGEKKADFCDVLQTIIDVASDYLRDIEKSKAITESRAKYIVDCLQERIDELSDLTE